MLQSSRRRDLLAIASLCATIALFFWKLLFTNLILARGDTFFYIYPYWTAAAEALRSGRAPLWNPNLFMGAPFLANSQAGVLYPLNWPLWLAFDTPTAASLSIVLHLWLAAGFSYGFARSGLGLRRPAAWLAAILFALGGYLTAQVEHINQLQGLAWLPAVFWLLSRMGESCHVDTESARFFPCFSPCLRGKKTGLWVRPHLLGAVLGLQLLAGHTQAAFITVVGAAVYALWLSLPALRTKLGRYPNPQFPNFPISQSPITHLLLAGLIALLLAAAQILPTIELGRHSVRGGGGLPLNEAISFSLHPLLLGRALLPGYGETIFSEYIAFLPSIVLLLALIGVWAGRRKPAVVGLALVGAMGLFFALGAANPIYLLLVKIVPGFSLFRAPARWLALYAFGAAGLAGVGLDALLARRQLPLRPLLTTWGLALLALIAWAFIAPLLTTTIPAPPESPVVHPSTITLIGWLIELLLTLIIISRPSPIPLRYASGTIVSHYLFPITLILFLASRVLPYNHPTAPEAYHALRPATAHLQAAAVFDGITPPGRFLSISDIFFDPGDTGELETIYADQLDDDAFYDLIIATKQKEILAPNLPLTFGVPAVDGYDGGVLPLANYVTLERLLLPADEVSMDGRLRENLDAIPDGRWLNLFNVRYLITDKVGDAWTGGVFYDLQHSAALDAAHPAVEVAYLSPFEATGLGIVISHPALPAGTPVAEVRVNFADGAVETLTLDADVDNPTLLRANANGTTLYVTRLHWPTPAIPTAITITQSPNSQFPNLLINGLTLIDERDGTFQSLVISGRGRYRLVHSGDVKIYQNLDVLPRAFLVGRATWAADDEVTLQRMGAADFDPAGEVVLAGPEKSASGEAGPLLGRVTVESYRPERIELLVETTGEGWLVLSDAYYPGWEATVEGEPVPIERANVLFRALPIRPGTQQIVFTYRPGSVRAGLFISGISLLLWLVGWLKARSSR